jgi:hypothetical protein
VVVHGHQCKCGSFEHQRTSHRSCRLNRNNRDLSSDSGEEEEEVQIDAAKSNNKDDNVVDVGPIDAAKSNKDDNVVEVEPMKRTAKKAKKKSKCQSAKAKKRVKELEDKLRRKKRDRDMRQKREQRAVQDAERAKKRQKLLAEKHKKHVQTVCAHFKFVADVFDKTVVEVQVCACLGN